MIITLLCCATLTIIAEEKKEPKVHDSLKELEWLVGDWIPEQGLLWGTMGDGVGLRGATITPSKNNDSLLATYVLACAVGSLIGFEFEATETIRFDKTAKQYVVECEIKHRPAKKMTDLGGGKGMYTLKKTGNNRWRGKGSFTPTGWMTSRSRKDVCNIELNKIDTDTFVITITERTYVQGPKNLTVKLIRKKQNKKPKH